MLLRLRALFTLLGCCVFITMGSMYVLAASVIGFETLALLLGFATMAPIAVPLVSAGIALWAIVRRRAGKATSVQDGGVTRLLLISDTHLPKRAKALPEEVWAEVDRADAVLHAGDWVEASLLDELVDRAKRVVGVWGNNDGDDLRSRLPEIARVEFDGIRFAMIHEPARPPSATSALTRSFRMPTLWCSGTATFRGTRCRPAGGVC